MTDAERTEGEAAAWVVRLHSDQRTQSDQEAFRAWLDADAANVEAFAPKLLLRRILTSKHETVGGGAVVVEVALVLGAWVMVPWEMLELMLG